MDQNMNVPVYFKDTDGKILVLECSLSEDIKSIKDRLCNKFNIELPVEQFNLNCLNNNLNDNAPLSDYFGFVTIVPVQ
jgi:hypothetical protein